MSAVVVGYGALTPVGLEAAATAAAVRAGISAYVEHPFIVDKRGASTIVARVPNVDIEFDVLRRLIRLARPPLETTLNQLPVGRQARLLLALPEPRPGLPNDLTSRFEAAVLSDLQDIAPLADVRCFANGSAGGLSLISEAARMLRDQPSDIIIVGGVDTHLIPETLDWWDEHDAIHGAEMPWGFCPSEAGAFVALAAGGEADVEILGVGIGHEVNIIRSDSVCLGEGLTAAWHNALASASCPKRGIARIVCDLNGEPYRADEYAFAMLRVGSSISEDAAFDTPARSWGDVGAAFGPLAMILAAESIRRGYSRWPLTLVSAGSDSGLRAALVLRATQ